MNPIATKNRKERQRKENKVSAIILAIVLVMLVISIQIQTLLWLKSREKPRTIFHEEEQIEI